MKKVAVISDVHGNAPALVAVLAEIERIEVDVIVSCGDLTWGPLPEETFELVRELDARFVRGNADRAVLEGRSETDREQWMQEHHPPEVRSFLETFEEQFALDVDGLGAVRFCHGSPRSDVECVTPETPEDRIKELSAGVAERVIVSGHIHVQFDREVAGVRSVNPGSVGLPYEGKPGAFWALLGPDIEHRRTEYDLEQTIVRYRASGQPEVEKVVEMMLEPPPPQEVIDYGEKIVFAD